ncbi:MAG: LiaI-LiaF-like domain-containing protein, partial [Candidatus Limnocylindrales bacterium]
MSQGNGGGSGRGEWAGISILGVVLIVIGAIFLVDQLGIFQFAWRVFWPILLIVIGVIVVVHAAGRSGHDGRARTSGTNASVVARDGAAR